VACIGDSIGKHGCNIQVCLKFVLYTNGTLFV
jgi:hypothetical protein